MPEEPEKPTAGIEPDPAGTQEEPETPEIPDKSGGEHSEESLEDPQERADQPFDRERYEAELKKKNSEAANLRKRLKEQEPLLADLKRRQDSEKSESERLNDQLAEATKVIEQSRKRLVKTSVRALAARPEGERAAFADPEDAVTFLGDLDTYLGSDGDVDEAQIEADLAELLKHKSHLAKQVPPEGPRRPAPDRTQASGANQKRPAPTPADEFAGWLKSKVAGR